MTENKKLESKNVFLDTENFSQFILKYKNHFEKRKYYQIDENFKIIKKEPSFILELAYIYFAENKENENIKKVPVARHLLWFASERAAYMVWVKVRVMTSICCSLVSELKRTA